MALCVVAILLISAVMMFKKYAVLSCSTHEVPTVGLTQRKNSLSPASLTTQPGTTVVGVTCPKSPHDVLIVMLTGAVNDDEPIWYSPYNGLGALAPEKKLVGVLNDADM